jgi:hypothetical protein
MSESEVDHATTLEHTISMVNMPSKFSGANRVRKVSSGFVFDTSIIRSCIERVIFSKEIIESLPGLTFLGDLLPVSIFQRTHT